VERKARLDFLKSHQSRSVTIKETKLKARLIDLTSDDDKNDSDSIQVAKFILIKKEDEVCLMFGLLKQFPYHAILVEHYCAVEKIETGTWEVKPDFYDVNNSRIKIKGGGWVEINVRDKSLKFFGVSKAYGPFDKANLVHVLSNHHYFSPFSVTIA
jgi:hypothetical protein